MSPERGQKQISLEEIIFNAEATLLRDGKHVPTLVVEGTKNLVAIKIPSLPETHGERVELMRFLGQAASKRETFEQLQQVYMVTEGWMSIVTNDKPAEIRPSQDPNRKEVLIVSGMQVKERKKHVKIFEILRDSNRKIVKLEEYLSDEKKKDESVEVPLLEAFVNGFQTAFRIKYN